MPTSCCCYCCCCCLCAPIVQSCRLKRRGLIPYESQPAFIHGYRLAFQLGNLHVRSCYSIIVCIHTGCRLVCLLGISLLFEHMSCEWLMSCSRICHSTTAALVSWQCIRCIQHVAWTYSRVHCLTHTANKKNTFHLVLVLWLLSMVAMASCCCCRWHGQPSA